MSSTTSRLKRDANRPNSRSPLWFAFRKWVLVRDGYMCQYCGKTVIDYPDGRREHNLATVDHIKPVSKNGLTCAENLVTACYECNMMLGNVGMTFEEKLLWLSRQLVPVLREILDFACEDAV